MLKIAPKTSNFAEFAVKFVEPATKIEESGTVCAIHYQIITNVFSAVKLSWKPQL